MIFTNAQSDVESILSLDTSGLAEVMVEDVDGAGV